MPSSLKLLPLACLLLVGVCGEIKGQESEARVDQLEIQLIEARGEYTKRDLFFGWKPREYKQIFARYDLNPATPYCLNIFSTIEREDEKQDIYPVGHLCERGKPQRLVLLHRYDDQEVAFKLTLREREDIGGSGMGVPSVPLAGPVISTNIVEFDAPLLSLDVRSLVADLIIVVQLPDGNYDPTRVRFYVELKRNPAGRPQMGGELLR